MAVVGFSFTKIQAERKPQQKGKINISNNIAISGVEDAEMNVDKSKQGVRVRFTFESKYEPKTASIRFEGYVILLEEKKTAETMLKEWEKTKKLPNDLMRPSLNHILERCNLQALITARDLGLPAPIPLPKVTPKEQGSAQTK